MSEFIPRLPARPSFEQLRKQACERLLVLRAVSPGAKLADAQFALAREYGFASWAALKQFASAPEPDLAEQYALLAQDLVDACGGDAGALTRLHHVYGADFTQGSEPYSAEVLRRKLGERLRVLTGSERVTEAGARLLVARGHGLGEWGELVRDRAGHFFRINFKENSITPGPVVSARVWDVIFGVMRERGITGLHAGGRMTDAALRKLAKLEFVTRVDLDGCSQVSDSGLAHLARMPQLRELDLSGWNGRITDDGLRVLGELRGLRKFQMCWQQNVTDAGLASLADCELLEEVNLMGTHAGDGALAVLVGKQELRQVTTGRQTTDVGIGHLHGMPCFAEWRGGELRYGLMGAGAWPTRVTLDGPFTDAGVARLKGLDGLCGVGFFWHANGFTAGALRHLAELPRLGVVACGESRCDDEAMAHIAAIPGLKMLLAQGAVAGDKGFAALGRSRTLEYLWGRDCAGLSSVGFRALAKLPALRGLAVNCAQVDDAALGMLPEFPALRELTPMNVAEAGFRHIGRCVELEALWCMYCRETGDAATAELSGLRGLKSYYAGATAITDASLEVLSTLGAMERVELWQCLGITDAGVRRLAGLPKLRELILGGVPGVTLAGTGAFPEAVRVEFSA